MNDIHRHRDGGPGRGIAMALTKTKKVIVEFPEDLLKQAERVASELSTDRSKLIRSAVETFLEDRAKMQLAEELAEGYRSFAALDLEIAKEFAHVDLEDH